MTIKKRIAKLLQSRLVGQMIRGVSGQSLRYYSGVRVPLRDEALSDTMVSSVYFGFYEKSESLLIEKYLRDDLPVIELGASLGLVSAVIGKNCNKSIVGIEPNAGLSDYHRHILSENGVQNYSLVTGAYSSDNGMKRFIKGRTNLHGRIVENSDSSEGVEIEGYSLKRLLEAKGLTGQYQLVSDIEGSEVQLLIDDSEALNNCALMIIEMHRTEYNGSHYSIEDIERLVIDLGFHRMDHRGNTAVFVREK